MKSLSVNSGAAAGAPRSSAPAEASPAPVEGADEVADKETSNADASLFTKILRTKLVVNKHDVEVQQNNPDSPLYSVKSFEELRL